VEDKANVEEREAATLCKGHDPPSLIILLHFSHSAQIALFSAFLPKILMVLPKSALGCGLACIC
jgi:hypothetical protein